MKLGAPISIEGYSSPISQETAPQASMITYNFKSGLDGTLFDLIWYDGGLKPNIPKGIEKRGFVGQYWWSYIQRR